MTSTEKEGEAVKQPVQTGVAAVFLMLGVVYLLTLDSKVIAVPFLLIGIGVLLTGWFSRRGGPRG
ncbi:hypothetical protein [Kocuria tytonicola]|uniref:hypothetical protein n=1 Tax=Kocuria tytonicola TaxID=2055946 RepID=UPI000F51A80C|nr:hypothetical protein [Kocuria tytonicola]